MPDLTLHPVWQTIMPVYQHAVGLGTHAFSALAFYLMVKKTPKSGRPFARYLILLQAWITLVDFNFGVLFCPIALYPIPGGLCNGVLCTVFGVSGHYGMVIMFATVTNMGASVIFCFHFKYLTILEMAKHRPVQQHHRILFRAVILIVYNIPTFTLMKMHRNIDTGPSFVQINYPSLYYLFENASCRSFAYDFAQYPEYIISMELGALTSSSMSEKTRKLQRKIMTMLLVQTMIPLFVQLAPMGIYLYSVATGSLNPNINNTIFCFQITHAFVHTTILILTTPSYREALMCVLMGNTICTPPNRAGTYGREVGDKVSADSVHPMPSSVAVTIAIKTQLAISTSIDNSLRKEKFEHSRRVKILLLGGADAGKSTILKQMRILHMTGFSDLEMHSFYNYLRLNVFEIFHEIALGVQENILTVSEDEKLMIYRFAEGISWFIGIDDEIETTYLLKFIELECVQTFMRLHPNYAALPDNAHYYFPKLNQLLAPDHIPTAEDILHLRIPTTGVSEINFTFSANTIRLIDVGGQRTYRKKWIHCFDGVAAVLFVASLAAYDQALEGVDVDTKPVLHRDLFPPVDQSEKRANRLRDSIKLFGEMLRCRFLRSSSFILFLNKTDLFAKKLPLNPLIEHFSGYDGASYEQASEYLREQFLKRKSKNDTERSIYSHYTCATDTKNVEFVFKAACDIVFQRNLHTTGAQ